MVTGDVGSWRLGPGADGIWPCILNAGLGHVCVVTGRPALGLSSECPFCPFGLVPGQESPRPCHPAQETELCHSAGFDRVVGVPVACPETRGQLSLGVSGMLS